MKVGHKVSIANFNNGRCIIRRNGIFMITRSKWVARLIELCFTSDKMYMEPTVLEAYIFSENE